MLSDLFSRREAITAGAAGLLLGLAGCRPRETASRDERLPRIQRKVRAAGKALNPVLSEEEVQAFERRHGISLPEGYRQFLLEIGNGGDGPPDYQLVRLGEGPDCTDKEWTRRWQELPDVGRPFPFTKPWVWERGDVSKEGTREQAWHGSIFLGTDGCGMDWHLIVTGPERGNVWQLTGEGITPTIPKRDFLRWYEDWLDGVTDWWDVGKRKDSAQRPHDTRR